MSSFPGEDPALQVIHSPPSEKLTSPFLESDSNRDETATMAQNLRSVFFRGTHMSEK